MSLLSWPAIRTLNIFTNVTTIFRNKDSIKALFPEVFLNLRKLGKP